MFSQVSSCCSFSTFQSCTSSGGCWRRNSIRIPSYFVIIFWGQSSGFPRTICIKQSLTVGLTRQYPFHIIGPHSRRPLVNHIENSTLGFEKVFAVGLPERSDKRDALALTSSLTGFKIDWIDGVRGQTILDNALPFGVDRLKLWETNLGSWRGHMNAVRK